MCTVHQAISNLSCLYLVRYTLIGLRRVDPSQYGFEWIDGTSVNDTYSNWADGEPDNNYRSEDCVVLDGSPIKWMDKPCPAPTWYMCQRKTGTVLL